MIVRVAGPGSMLGLYAALSHGVYEVSAESLTPAQLRPVERERFLTFLRNHKEAQMRAVQCICQEYRFALQDACRIALAETVAGRLGRLLLELAHQIGEHVDGGIPLPAAADPRRDGLDGLHHARNRHPHSGPIPQGRLDLDRGLDDHAASARAAAKPDLAQISSLRAASFAASVRASCQSPRDIMVTGSIGTRMIRFAVCFSVVLLSCTAIGTGFQRPRRQLHCRSPQRPPPKSSSSRRLKTLGRRSQPARSVWARTCAVAALCRCFRRGTSPPAISSWPYLISDEDKTLHLEQKVITVRMLGDTAVANGTYVLHHKAVGAGGRKGRVYPRI